MFFNIFLNLSIQSFICRTDLHLWAQNRIVTGQLSAVDGVHRIHWGMYLCGWSRCRGTTFALWDGGTGWSVKLEQCLHICAVLVGKSLLILVCPLADPALPSLFCVLIQHTSLCGRVLYKSHDQENCLRVYVRCTERNFFFLNGLCCLELSNLTFILIDFLEPSLKA